MTLTFKVDDKVSPISCAAFKTVDLTVVVEKFAIKHWN